MKIAALYDIHGNFPALQAVLEELKEVKPDRIVIGGDFIFGPMPIETLEALSKLGDQVVYIRGNGDREIVLVYDGKELPKHLSGAVKEEAEWVAGKLSPEMRDFLAHLPSQVEYTIEGLGHILFCHATPRNDYEIFTPLSPKERIEAMFTNVTHDWVVCGHTHVQFKESVENISILNAGSVGMPYAEKPGAYWALISCDGYEFRYTPYDLQAAALLIESSGNPQASDFIQGNLLSGPKEDEALEFLEKLANENKMNMN
ncbi:metallophosphoesterase family protein [Bacillus horti]|uniref:Phosphoesterase n=1 Tax=Caldalkalibacillus horti TaxID=77523 RepID=A0ABT9VYP1_9BACI|nr:metallophosphoesterase family protein [Bacillus horti]MDQ0166009.1 putative phosphoesterase [Bacillus horti]